LEAKEIAGVLAAGGEDDPESPDEEIETAMTDALTVISSADQSQPLRNLRDAKCISPATLTLTD